MENLTKKSTRGKNPLEIKRKLIILLLTLSSVATLAQSIPDKEHQIKAIFLYNITQFVRWPKDSFSEINSPLVIGILGNNPFGNYLSEVIQGEAVENHPLIVRYLDNIDEVKDCHLLYVNEDNLQKLQFIFESLKFAPILTIGESEFFYKNGGMVQLYTKKGKVRIKINLETLKTSLLDVSATLLQIADVD